MGYVKHPPFCAFGRCKVMRYTPIILKNVFTVDFQHSSIFYINFLQIYCLEIIFTFFKNLYMLFSQKSENVTWPTFTLSSSNVSIINLQLVTTSLILITFLELLLLLTSCKGGGKEFWVCQIRDTNFGQINFLKS